MSASLDIESDWNFRALDKRLIVVKAKNKDARKVASFRRFNKCAFCGGSAKNGSNARTYRWQRVFG